MKHEVPLGHKETERLEFKGKDALQRLTNVSREAVAMLNAGGGKIWIGLGEEDGRAVRVEPIENVDREIGRLRDHFSDSIEPSPVTGEIVPGEVVVDGDGKILVIEVAPNKKRAPYALRDGTARHFLKRVGDRVRSMSSEEIRDDFRSQTGADAALEQALGKLRKSREQNRDKSILWLRIQPVEKAELNVTRKYEEYFTDPLKTGNRISGWNFVNGTNWGGNSIRRTKEGVRCGNDDQRYVEIFSDGAIEFHLPIVGLYWWAADPLSKTDSTEIWPYCILEFPISIFRLASTIYRDHEFAAETFVADLALFGIKGWTLRRFSPESIRYRLTDAKPFPENEIVWDEPLSFTREQIVNEPDRCGFRLVARVYQAFGIYEEFMPREFNREAGKLILPQ
ncbi:MAG: AlbA family DNA-binding domain-containing protein [Candidatus Binataceae bacterium]